MYKFKVGDKVRCISDSRDTTHYLTKGDIYTVTRIVANTNIVLTNSFGMTSHVFWAPARFELVKECPLIVSVKPMLKAGNFVKRRQMAGLHHLKDGKVYEVEYKTSNGFLVLKGCNALINPSDVVKVKKPSFDEMIKAINALPKTESVSEYITKNKWDVDELLRRAI